MPVADVSWRHAPTRTTQSGDVTYCAVGPCDELAEVDVFCPRHLAEWARRVAARNRDLRSALGSVVAAGRRVVDVLTIEADDPLPWGEAATVEWKESLEAALSCLDAFVYPRPLPNPKGRRHA